MSLADNSDRGLIAEVGQKAPDFVLDANDGEKWRLSDHLGQVTALLFYPKNETLVCTRQMCSVRNNWADYLETKASIIGISPGSVEEHRRFSQHHRLPLPLLADTDRNVTEIYARHWIYPVFFTRAVVIVDAKGFVRRREIMLRAFRPTDRSILTSIYEARNDFLNEHYKTIRDSYRRRG